MESFVQATKWRRIPQLEKKKVLMEEITSRGKKLLKIREDRRATIIMESEVVDWLKGFVDGLLFAERIQGWGNETKNNGKRFTVENRRNRNEGFILLTEFFGKGRKQLVCLPEGQAKQGWKMVAGALDDFDQKKWEFSNTEEQTMRKEQKSGEVSESQTGKANQQKQTKRITPITVRRNGDWFKRKVAKVKTEVKDWEEVLQILLETLQPKEKITLIPFEKNKAILDMAELQTVSRILETNLGQIAVENWSPSCNELNISQKTIVIKILGLPFNLWQEHIFHKIAVACGGVLEGFCMQNLQAAKIKVTCGRLERIPRSLDIFADDCWRKVWLVSEVEARLWNSLEVEEDDDVDCWRPCGESWVDRPKGQVDQAFMEIEKLGNRLKEIAWPFKGDFLKKMRMGSNGPKEILC
ncbi:PREDICTED: uncharacterized protein LOC104602313 isoform X1 [Nelumbo nucifera]|uniref:Uncharacterized protein LOC104602313 isoform X1 n=1 Tax=Nelumbo nucifera TaxID=4432 RepID=A0A1U8Q7W2_NELNU|nr:PREDICTED: uncharacterized protein LOC104602313 isoform X1 [Nelumbo nucifera]